jgi:hypothetical protein
MGTSRHETTAQGLARIICHACWPGRSRLPSILTLAAAALACSDTIMEGIGHGSQQLSGKLGDTEWHYATGLGRYRETWTVGLYPELSDPGFSPTLSYIEILAPGPGEYRVGDTGFQATFMLCGPETPVGGCLRAVSRQVPATQGEVDISQTEVEGAMRLEGGALLMDELGDQVDGVFAAIPLYAPTCTRGERLCQGGDVLRCSWDERVWLPEATCGEQLCGSAVEQCNMKPASCLVALSCMSLR